MFKYLSIFACTHRIPRCLRFRCCCSERGTMERLYRSNTTRYTLCCPRCICRNTRPFGERLEIHRCLKENQCFFFFFLLPLSIRIRTTRCVCCCRCERPKKKVHSRAKVVSLCVCLLAGNTPVQIQTQTATQEPRRHIGATEKGISLVHEG